MSAASIDIITRALKDIQSSRYSELASSTIIIYDHLITWDQEVQFVWKASWSLGKILFIMNRYYSLFTVLFNNYALFSATVTDELSSSLSCLNWFRWQGWTGLVACAIAEVILQLRLYALYYRDKKVLALMATCFLSAMAASAAIMGTVLRDITAQANLIPSVTFCVGQNVSTHFYVFWVPILCFETLLCGLAIFRGYKTYRDQELLRRKRLQFRRNTTIGNISKPQVEIEIEDEPTILEILLRDSIMFFIIMFAAYFTTTMVWIFGRTTVIEIPVGFTVAMSCVIGNRLLLNVRSSHHHQAHLVTVYRANASAAHMSMSGSSNLQIGSSSMDSITEDRLESRMMGNTTTVDYELHTLSALQPHSKRVVT